MTASDCLIIKCNNIDEIININLFFFLYENDEFEPLEAEQAVIL